MPDCLGCGLHSPPCHKRKKGFDFILPLGSSAVSTSTACQKFGDLSLASFYKMFWIPKAYDLEQQSARRGKQMNGVASAYADIQWEQPHQPDGPRRDPLRYPHRDILPVASYAPQPDYMEGDDDLIKPKKLINPVKSSKSHQELHRELLMNHKRGVENKPELQRVLEQRKREQMIKQRKQEEEARRKISPLEQELQKRHKKLEELEKEQERQEECSRSAPEFIKVKENLRRTSFTSSDEKEV